MPQTRFVLQQGARARPAADRGHQQGRPPERPHRRGRLGDVQDLFLDLATDEEQLDFPVIYTIARDGRAGICDPTTSQPTWRRCSTRSRSTSRRPTADLDGALPDAGHHARLRRVPRPDRHRPRRSRPAIGPASRSLASTATGDDRAARQPGVSTSQGLAARAGRGGQRPATSWLITGLEGVQIGDTIADAEHPEALPRLEVEEPTVQMTFGVNTSPFAGREGKFVTSRQLRARLCARAGDQRRAARRGDRQRRRLPGHRPRRAAPGDPGRDDAPRGLRVRGLAARGRSPARSNGKTVEPVEHLVDRHHRGVRRRADRAAGRAPGPDDQPATTTAAAACAWSTRSRPAA